MISSSMPFNDLPFVSESLREPALHYLCSSYFSRILSLHSLPALCFTTNSLLFFRSDVLSLASGASAHDCPVHRIFVHSLLLLTPFHCLGLSWGITCFKKSLLTPGPNRWLFALPWSWLCPLSLVMLPCPPSVALDTIWGQDLACAHHSGILWWQTFRKCYF